MSAKRTRKHVSICPAIPTLTCELDYGHSGICFAQLTFEEDGYKYGEGAYYWAPWSYSI